MELTISVKNKVFDNGGVSTHVLWNVDFVVAPGSITGVFGPSGCGKSTLLRIIAGLDRNFLGHIMLGPQVITKPTRNIGFVVQTAVCYDWLSVSGNIGFGLRYAADPRELAKSTRIVKEDPDEKEEAVRIASLVGLSDADLRKRPSEISGGMKQRMAFGRALIVHPKVLLLDEPFSALDFESRQSLQDVVVRVREELGISFVCVSHDPEEMLYLADEIIVLHGQPASVIHRLKPELPHHGTEESRYTQEFQLAKKELQEWLNLPREKKVPIK